MAQRFCLQPKSWRLMRLHHSLEKEARWQEQHAEPSSSPLQKLMLIGGALAVLALGLLGSYQSRRMATRIELEEERELLSVRLHHARVMSKSWGYRNDSFNFLQNKHPNFARLHLRDPDLLGNETVMLFFDLDGRLVFNSLQHDHNRAGLHALKALQQCIAPHAKELHGALESLTKLCSTPSGSYLMAASTIANDTWDAPVKGHVGLFTPVNAMPSPSIHNAHMQEELERLARARLTTDAPELKRRWQQVALPISADDGLDIAPSGGAWIGAPVTLSSWNWLRGIAPLGLLSGVMIVRRQWSLLRLRRKRLVTLQQLHISKQHAQQQQRHHPIHGLLSSSAFGKRFTDAFSWSWDSPRELVLLQLQTSGDPQRSHGSSITLATLLPNLCHLVGCMGYSNVACQSDADGALLCLRPNPAEAIPSQIERLRSRCGRQLQALQPLSAFSLTATHLQADRATTLEEQRRDLTLMAAATRLLGNNTMAVDRSNPAFVKEWQGAQLEQELLEIASGTRPLHTRCESLHHCPSTDPLSWQLHHLRLQPSLQHAEESQMSSHSLNALIGELGLGDLIFQKVLHHAARHWQTTATTTKLEISSGLLDPRNIQNRSAVLRDAIARLPRTCRQRLILAMASQNASGQELQPLEGWLHHMGVETLQATRGVDDSAFNLCFERTPHYLSINCREMDKHSTDTLMSWHRFLQDASTQMGCQLIGEAINSEAQFHFWHKLGMTLFAGPWIERHASRVRSG